MWHTPVPNWFRKLRYSFGAKHTLSNVYFRNFQTSMVLAWFSTLGKFQSIENHSTESTEWESLDNLEKSKQKTLKAWRQKTWVSIQGHAL